MTTDWQRVVNDPQVQIVIELVGGTTIARTMILAALRLGKPVVTANKALLSAHGEELFAAAEKYGANLYYEASVCGRHSRSSSRCAKGSSATAFTHLYGIVNGTCNYILTRMKHEGADFADVLADAQRLGYAETPPDLDIDGFDAAAQDRHPRLAGARFLGESRSRSTSKASATSRKLDMQFAEQLGYTIKLLGIVKKLEPPAGKAGTDRACRSRSIRRSIPNAHVLASVNGVFNAVFVRGDVVGDTLFYGRGAGKDATASAVLSDVADAALDLKHGTKRRVPPFVPHERDGRGRADRRSGFALLRPAERGGPARACWRRSRPSSARPKIGISSVIQPEGHEGESVPLILMIHDAPNAAMRKALAKIAKLPVVKGDAGDDPGGEFRVS